MPDAVCSHRHLALVALVLAATACDSVLFRRSKTCPDIGCLDQFSATVSMTGSTSPSGTHTVTVTADGKTDVCTFVFPPVTLPSGGVASPQCTGAIEVSVLPATVCTETRTDAAATQQCSPVADRFQETITIPGTPKAVHVQQSAGGTVILEQSATPTYEANPPNSPGCTPLCHQATAAWAIP